MRGRCLAAAALLLASVACSSGGGRTAAPPPSPAPVPMWTPGRTASDNAPPGAVRSASARPGSPGGTQPAPLGSPSGPVARGTKRPAPTGVTPMCEPSRYARCVDLATARSWWGSPMLLPNGNYDARFLQQHQQGRFAPGDAERYLPSSLALVLTFGGGPTPDRADQPDVLSGGGIVVLGTRQTKVFDAGSNERPVPVRGQTGFTGEARSVSTGRTLRYVEWVVRDGDHFIVWQALDDPARRSLDELVHLLDALAES